MTSTSLNTLLTQVLRSGNLNAEHFSNIRRAIYHDGNVSLEEANLLFQINDQIADKPEDWSSFFVGAMTDFLVRQTVPHGYIDTANAAWLMERIDHDGVVESETEFNLLMNILKKAISVTDRLELYVLGQVQQSVALGRGYLSENTTAGNLTLTKKHVDVVRDVIYACGGDGGFGVTKAEAEFLFDLNDATQHSANHESWPVLFVGGVANHIMMLSAPEPLSIDAARHTEEFLLKPGGGISFRNMAGSFEALTDNTSARGWVKETDDVSFKSKGAFKKLKSILFNELPPSFITDGQALSASERIDPNEAKWLIDRLDRDGAISANEVTLLQFIKEECGDIDESLQALVDKAA